SKRYVLEKPSSASLARAGNVLRKDGILCDPHAASRRGSESHQLLDLLPDLAPLGPQPGGQVDGLHQARLIGDTFARNVKSGAVVDRGPDDGQAHRHVDTFVEVEALEDRMPLV